MAGIVKMRSMIMVEISKWKIEPFSKPWPR
jgi:hypothetical protein